MILHLFTEGGDILMKRKRNLVNDTIIKLEKYIIENNLSHGERLPTENELTQLLNIGRSTLREAVRILAYSNILEVKQGSGTYVKSLNFNTEFSDEQLLEVKTMIEIQASEIAATKEIDVEVLVKVKELLFERKKYLDEGKFSKYIISDLDFHLKIIECSGNPFLIRWYNEIYEDVKLTLSRQMIKIDHFKDTNDLHNALFQAIVNQKPEKIRQLLLNIRASN